MRRPGPPDRGLGVGFKAPPHKKPVVREYKESYDPYQAVMPKMMTRKVPPTIKGNLKKYLKQIFVEKCNKAAYKNKIITYFCFITKPEKC
jgi:hypothetical protein